MSLRKAINEKCVDCIYDPIVLGTSIQQVSMCTSFSCPLWTVRPVSKLWNQVLPLHDRKLMMPWMMKSTDQFYRDARKLYHDSVTEQTI